MTLEFRLEIVIWRVPSLIGSAVTVSIVGVLVRLKLCSRPSPWVTILIRWTPARPNLPNRDEPRWSHPAACVVDRSVFNSRSQNLPVVPYFLTAGSQDRLDGSPASVRPALRRSRL